MATNLGFIVKTFQKKKNENSSIIYYLMNPKKYRLFSIFIF